MLELWDGLLYEDFMSMRLGGLKISLPDISSLNIESVNTNESKQKADGLR
eukprot:IDg7090t1